MGLSFVGRTREYIDVEKDSDDLEEHIEEEIVGLENVSPFIKFLIDFERFPEELEPDLELAVLFSQEIIKRFRNRILSLLGKYYEGNEEDIEKALAYLESKDYDVPSLTIAYGFKADSLLDTLGIDHNYNGNRLLLVFELPDPFYLESLESDLVKDPVAWEEFEKETSLKLDWKGFSKLLAEEVQHTRDDFRKNNNMGIYRTTNEGAHKPGKYYYVWEVSRKGR